ncbi:hypothetical protein GC177_05205 [bacterium]|nr:hypothetical protein [bacterium]
MTGSRVVPVTVTECFAANSRDIYSKLYDLIYPRIDNARGNGGEFDQLAEAMGCETHRIYNPLIGLYNRSGTALPFTLLVELLEALQHLKPFDADDRATINHIGKLTGYGEAALTLVASRAGTETPFSDAYRRTEETLASTSTDACDALIAFFQEAVESRFESLSKLNTALGYSDGQRLSLGVSLLQKEDEGSHPSYMRLLRMIEVLEAVRPFDEAEWCTLEALLPTLDLPLHAWFGYNLEHLTVAELLKDDHPTQLAEGLLCWAANLDNFHPDLLLMSKVKEGLPLNTQEAFRLYSGLRDALEEKGMSPPDDTLFFELAGGYAPPPAVLVA